MEMCRLLSTTTTIGRSRGMNNIFWKDAQGDDLPEIDREVIVIDKLGKVFYAHRPQEKYSGMSLQDHVIEEFYPKRYDNGGWNIPDIKYWLDLDIPNNEIIIEKQ